MSQETEGDIEFLDEDADIVQQCVQNVDNPVPNFDVETELLVERMPLEIKSNKRKRKIDRDDSDYDPYEDIHIRRNRKRKQTQNISYQTQNYQQPQRQNISRHEQNTPRQTGKFQLAKFKKDPVQTQKRPLKSDLDIKERRKFDIIVPDYDDPLCLPVRAVIKDDDDAHKLKSWNNLCLEKFKQLDKPMRVEKDDTISSKRTIVLRNLRNSLGKVESTIYSKIIVANKAGTKKTELIQSVLPKYRERKVLNNIKLFKKTKKPSFYRRTEVLLTQDTGKDEDTLVIYNPQESLSMVYKMYEKECDPKMGEEDRQKYIKETSCSKMCATCYQESYKGYKSEDQNIYCYICKRVCASAHYLVSHLKTHSHADIRKYKNVLSKDLVGSVTYKCRICQNKFPSIKELRKHVNTHKGHTPFYCEVGKHMVQ